MRFLQSDFEQTKKVFKALKGSKQLIVTELSKNQARISTADIKVTLNKLLGTEANIMISHESMESLCKMKTKGDITFEDNKIYIAGRKTNLDYSEEIEETKQIALDGDYISYECKGLKEVLKDVIYSKAKTEERPILKGISIKGTEFVSVDGYRITLKRTNAIYTHPSVESQIVIPGCLAEMLIKTLPNKGNCVMHADKDVVQFTFDNVVITSATLRGEYLNYNQVFTNDVNWEVKVNRLKLLEAVQFHIDANDKEPIKLKVNMDKTLTVNGEELNAEYEKVGHRDEAIHHTGIAFNPNYLKESLEHITDDVLTLQLISSLTPLTIQHSRGKDLILPVRFKA